MKYRLLLILMSFISISIAAPKVAFAPTDQACKNLENACKTGGYIVDGELQHKGLWGDCMAPLLNGKVITGLKVNTSDVKSCIETMKKMPQTKLLLPHQ